jgi:glycyl-tRNA synthetase
MSKFDEMQKICLSRGIIFPTAEIYSKLSGFYDYGNVGTLLKRKIIDFWREFFVKLSPVTVLELDGCVILPEDAFIASGHLKNFTDPITQCKKCRTVFRADHLIEEKGKEFVEGNSVQELTEMLKKHNIKCQKCGGELEDARIFNLMLRTEISPAGGQVGYLRPETAQNIFSAFQRISKTSRAKLPFGVAQVGHSFRNEISPRQFIIRLREFSQCEIELFVDPDYMGCPIEDVMDSEIIFLSREAQKNNEPEKCVKIKDVLGEFPNNWIAYFLAKEFEFYKMLGIPDDCIRIRHLLQEETAHYSLGNFDVEIKYDFGWKETVSNASRGDYDLKSHMKQSGVDLSILTDDGRKVIPNVIEPSFGLERTIAAVLYHSFRQDKERGWDWFSFPVKISPYTTGVFPLVNKDGLPEKAREIFLAMKKDLDSFYDEKGSIGKRYARADEIGTPFCITIDYQTMEDNTVTIRKRDTATQERMDWRDVKNFIEESL